MLRFRAAAVTAALLTAAAPAAAQEVCVLRSIETITAPRKPNIFEMQLDCGLRPTAEQERAIGLANNSENTVEALETMVRMGYEIETSDWRDSYTGRQILGVYTLVKEGEGVSVEPAEAELADEPAELPEVPAALPVEPEPEGEGFDDTEEPGLDLE